MICVTCCRVVATLLLLVSGSSINESFVLRFNQSSGRVGWTKATGSSVWLRERDSLPSIQTILLTLTLLFFSVAFCVAGHISFTPILNISVTSLYSRATVQVISMGRLILLSQRIHILLAFVFYCSLCISSVLDYFRCIMSYRNVMLKKSKQTRSKVKQLKISL